METKPNVNPIAGGDTPLPDAPSTPGPTPAPSVLYTEAVKQSIAHIGQADAAIKPFTVDIAEPIVNRLVRVAAKRGAFLDDFVTTAIANPQYLPANAGVDKIAGLQQKITESDPLANAIIDFYKQVRGIDLEAGDELYSIAVLYLKTAEVAAKGGDLKAQSICDRLQALRPSGGGKKKPEKAGAGTQTGV
jgi:hypothetical protein